MRRETSAAIGELFRGFSGYVQACGDDRGGTLARTFGARYVWIRELGLRTRRPAGDCDVKVNRLTGAAFYLNGALATGRYQDIDIATVKAAIRQGTIFDFLEERLGDDLDISLWDNDDRAEILAESRKFCVVENGLSLLSPTFSREFRDAHAKRADKMAAADLQEQWIGAIGLPERLNRQL